MRLCFERLPVLVLPLLLLVPCFIVEGQDSGQNVTGSVFDSESREPIAGALLIAVYSGGRQSTSAMTDDRGQYTLQVPEEGWCTIYAFKDQPETPGIDYVPARWRVYVQGGGSYSYAFNLLPGASILVKGSVRFVESAQPATEMRFSVISLMKPVQDPLIGVYGDRSLALLGLNATHVVVPANAPVWLEMTASVTPQTVLRGGIPPMVVPPELEGSGSRQLSLGSKEDYFELSQGAILELSVERHFVQLNLRRVEAVISASFSQLTRMEDLGFLVAAERQDLVTAMESMDQALIAVKEQLHDEAYSGLRRAYLLAAEAWNRMSGLSVDAYNSAMTLTFFLALTASLLVGLLSEGNPRLRATIRERHGLSVPLRPVYIAGLYALLLVIFYFAFPGCRLLGPEQFITAAAFSSASMLLLIRLPNRFDRMSLQDRSISLARALIVAFSTAYRYMRRRRLRTTLSLVTVAVAVFSFITLTSFSIGRGLVSRSVGSSKVLVDSLLVRNPGSSDIQYFRALDEAFLEWLASVPGVMLVAPRAESEPRLQPLDYLWRSGKSYPVRGILGIDPSSEAEITRLQSIVVEGIYLREGEPNDSLVGTGLAESTGIKLGDTISVLGRSLTVVGLFSEESMGSLQDVDGSPLSPAILVQIQVEPPLFALSPCPGRELIITTFNAALTMPGVSFSRVDVLAESREKLLRLSEEVVLTHEFISYVGIDGEVRLLLMGEYLEEKGLGQTLFIVALIALLIGNMMLGAVHERRNELAVFSSVGLNPSHISAVFLSEALIIGLIGGGIGYLAGICSYRALGLAVGALLVREKASVEWGLVALIVSVMATILGTVVPALKASTIVTPSLLRKWRVEEQGDRYKPWIVDIPVRIRARELELFLSFAERGLTSHAIGATRLTFKLSNQKVAPEDVQATRSISFTFQDLSSGKLSHNELVISPAEEGYFKATLYSTIAGFNEDLVRDTGAFVRNLLFEWNVTAFKLVTPVDSLSQLYTLVDTYHPKVLYAVSAKRDLAGHLGTLKEQWLQEGTRVPKITPIAVDDHDIEECLRRVDEAVSGANLVCVTGGSSATAVALAMSALKHGKAVCYATDPRSYDEQKLKPFSTYPVKIARP